MDITKIEDSNIQDDSDLFIMKADRQNGELNVFYSLVTRIHPQIVSIKVTKHQSYNLIKHWRSKI